MLFKLMAPCYNNGSTQFIKNVQALINNLFEIDYV